MKSTEYLIKIMTVRIQNNEDFMKAIKDTELSPFIKIAKLEQDKLIELRGKITDSILWEGENGYL